MRYAITLAAQLSKETTFGTPIMKSSLKRMTWVPSTGKTWRARNKRLQLKAKLLKRSNKKSTILSRQNALKKKPGSKSRRKRKRLSTSTQSWPRKRLRRR